MADEFLFVYGTLRKDYAGNPYKSTFDSNTGYLGKAFIFGKLYLVDYYPGLVKNKIGESYKAFGEIYRLNKPIELLKILDVYEDYFQNDHNNSLYIREKANCFLLENQECLESWTYFYNKAIDKLNYFKNGDFFDKVY